MDYISAQQKIEEGNHITRIGWGACKIIRKAIESDADYINYPLQGLIVESCDQRICDCEIAIFRPTKDDLEATDYTIVL